MPKFNISELKDLKGKELGVSDWVTVDQKRINSFADCTEDHQFIHVDEERANKETPFGGTIAHGFLTLSLLSKLSYEVAVKLNGAKMGINYGFEKIRFIQPVPAGSKIRGRFIINDVIERKPGQWMINYGVTIEIEGQNKPAALAEWLTIQML